MMTNESYCIDKTLGRPGEGLKIKVINQMRHCTRKMKDTGADNENLEYSC